MTTITGVVTKQPWAVGSKSEHQAAILTDDKTQKRYRVRSASGELFNDPQVDALVGSTIKAKGEVVHGNTLIMSSWTVVAQTDLDSTAPAAPASKPKSSI